MYGFRVVGPILLGMGRVPAWKFMVFNFLGAAIWAPVIAGIGYAFGSILKAVLADVQRYEIWLFAGVVAAGIITVVFHHLRSRKES
jgi:membrane protein DedA with SNARE-associated domain